MSRLVLLRHGESTANAEDRFAGWLDVPLTPRGLAQAKAAGRSLAALRPDAVHTSVLGRSIDTACLMAAAASWHEVLRPELRTGRTVVVVSHGNAARILLHLATGVPLEEAAQLQVPTAMPIMLPALALTGSPLVP